MIVCKECGTEVKSIYDYDQCDGWDICPECGAIESTKEIEDEEDNQTSNI